MKKDINYYIYILLEIESSYKCLGTMIMIVMIQVNIFTSQEFEIAADTWYVFRNG